MKADESADCAVLCQAQQASGKAKDCAIGAFMGLHGFWFGYQKRI
jgi:hypothetical protein